MTTITTDYTDKANENTLACAPLTKYRLTHWLVDLLKNFMSDPINLRDERISRLLNIQDGQAPDACKSLFIVDVPFNTDTRKACTTPAIMVSAGETQYPQDAPLNYGWGARAGAINAMQMYKRQVTRIISATVAVITESCDGTCLLTDIIEDFLVRISKEVKANGMIHQFNVMNSSSPKRIGAGEGMNAKDIYQSVISLAVMGGIAWTADTQGPVFRGVSGPVTQQ